MIQGKAYDYHTPTRHKQRNHLSHEQRNYLDSRKKIQSKTHPRNCGEKDRVKKRKAEANRQGREKKGKSRAFHARLSQRLLQPVNPVTVRCAACKMDVVAHKNPHFSADHSQPLKVGCFTTTWWWCACWRIHFWRRSFGWCVRLGAPGFFGWLETRQQGRDESTKQPDVFYRHETCTAFSCVL